MKNLFAKNLPTTVLGALLLAVALYGLVSLLAWFAYRIPGVPGILQAMAKGIGVSTPQLLEFNAIMVAAVFVAVQLWTTYRRADAAETTAAAAMQTAESTEKRNSAQQFKDAVELLESESDIVRTGGILSLTFIARDYPEYQDTVLTIIESYINQSEETDDEESTV